MSRARTSALRWLPRPGTLNMPLIIGGTMTTLFVGVALAAPWLWPRNPLEPVIHFVNGAMVKAPYPPGTQGMLLGSDMDRRDILGLLIYGARYTLLFAGLVAAVRMLIGSVVGVIAGWSRRLARVIDPIMAAVAAIPGLVAGLVVVVLLRGNGNFATTLLIAGLLGLVGWTEIAIRCKVATSALRSATFVQAAEALGVGQGGILRKHIIPNLRDVLVPEAAFAMTAALLLLAELGFLNVFLSTVDEDGIPLYIEWGMMIARGFRARAYGAWMIWEPMIVFSVAILSFYLLAEGLRRRHWR